MCSEIISITLMYCIYMCEIIITNRYLILKLYIYIYIGMPIYMHITHNAYMRITFYGNIKYSILITSIKSYFYKQTIYFSFY